MRKIDLLEWALITVGVIFGFRAFESFFYMLITLQYESFIPNFFTRALLPIILYFLGFILVIRFSRKLSLYLVPEKNNEVVPVKLDKRAVLHVVLIAICIGTIFTNLGSILIYIFEDFKSQVGNKGLHEPTPESVFNLQFKQEVIETLIAIITLALSRTIVSWFVKKDEVEKLFVDTNPNT